MKLTYFEIKFDTFWEVDTFELTDLNQLKQVNFRTRQYYQDKDISGVRSVMNLLILNWRLVYLR